ncbi:beta-lactamase [Naviculisporaceae sp. PSN 640]
MKELDGSFDAVPVYASACTRATPPLFWTSDLTFNYIAILCAIAVFITFGTNFAFGERSLWASIDGYNGTLLPPDQQEDAKIDTIYEFASLTKMFTTVAALHCLDHGLIASLNDTVVTYLPSFTGNGRENVTILHLLTHTSGFQAGPSVDLWTPRYPTYASRIAAILSEGLINPPAGSTYLYSDINFMLLMLVIESVTAKPLDVVISELPRPGVYNRTAPTEFQVSVVGPSVPQRPQPVRGTVHDENAFGLDGVSGHAGLFSNALDTAKLCQMVLNNGTYGGTRILPKRAINLIFINFNARFGPGEEHGVGFELNQEYTAGPMANLGAASHTGFTGTSMVVDRRSGTVFVMLANRVHPSREWSSNNVVRRTLGTWVAVALGRSGVKFP